MAEHQELVAEMPVLEQMGTQERQKLAKKRRNQQLKRWNQREKEWLAKEKQLNKRLANKISEENNGLNLKQYTTYSSNHRSKKNNPTTKTTGVNNNNTIFSKSNNGTNLKTINRFQASNGPKQVGLAPNGRVHFNVGVMLLEAAARNDYEEVKRLLILGVSPDSVNHDGLTALHQCCIDASEPIMSLLIEFGANVDARDTEQWTPLHAACTCGHLNLVKILVENGANLLAVNGDGNMPFDICEDEATLDYLETQMVERGITQELIDQTRVSTEMQMIDDLKERIAFGAENLNEASENGATPLHVAAANGYLSVVQLLIENGVDVNVCDNDLWTPLHGVACWGNEQHSRVVELLVEAGAQLDSKTSNDETAFDLCDNAELLEKLNQLKDELASKQAASNPDLLKRTQSKSNSRIHSVRRTSVRDKNQISRREAREEAMLRVDSNTADKSSQDQTGKQEVTELDSENSNVSPKPKETRSADEIDIFDQLDGDLNSTTSHDRSIKEVNSCKQTDTHDVTPISIGIRGQHGKQSEQNGFTNGSQGAYSASNESMNDQVNRYKSKLSNNELSMSQQDMNTSNGLIESLNDKLSSRHSTQSTLCVVKKSTKTSSSSTKVPMPGASQAQGNDPHYSNDTTCDATNHQNQNVPTLVPCSYTLANLKKQRSDLRMRTTSIGGSTTTIIVSKNSNGSVSLNPKLSIDDDDSSEVEDVRSGSPRTTFRKFSGEPSEVIGENKREGSHTCCRII